MSEFWLILNISTELEGSRLFTFRPKGGIHNQNTHICMFYEYSIDLQSLKLSSCVESPYSGFNKCKFVQECK